jgi:uncharacterized cupredoxin-like copper-binding protein
MAIGLVGAWALGCSGDTEAPLEPVPPPEAAALEVPVSFSPGTPGVTTTYCMEDQVQITNGSNAVPLNCTSNDVLLAATVLPVGTVVECFQDEIIPDPVELQGTLIANANERWDIGIWLALDGGDALRGNTDGTTPLNASCNHYFLEPTLSTTAFNGSPPGRGPAANGQDFFDGEDTEDPTDTCGDLEQGVLNILTPLTLTDLKCNDADGDGFLDVGGCVAWDNTRSAGTAQKPSCDGTTPAAAIISTLPNTKAKCRCDPIPLPIVVKQKGYIEVIKSADFTGSWTLYIDKDAGPPDEFSITGGDGVTTGKRQVGAGTQLNPGQDHAVQETGDLADFTSDISCVDRGETTFDGGAPLTTTGAGPLTVPVDPNDDIVCTISNLVKRGTIIVEKQTMPDGSTQQFAFTGDAAGTIGDGGQITVGNLLPGAYSSVETLPSGWALMGIVCDDGNSTGDVPNKTANFNVEAGETVKCIFTNTQDGVIVVDKVTTPSGDPQSFGFTGTACGAFSLTDVATPKSCPQPPGTYSVAETVPSGWDLTSATCDDSSNPSSIGLGPGETVTCTFTNTKKGKIIVEKQTVPNGDPASFTFTGDAAGAIVDGGTIEVDVEPGTYTSTETVPAGWDLTSIGCDDGNSSGNVGTATATFMVEAGETVKCTFTDTKRGNIKVKKVTVPSGDPQSFSFSGDVVASLTDGQTSSAVEVVPGSYSSTETVPAGWDLTSIGCDDANSSGSGATANFNVEAGESVTCTFTNTKRGTIIVEKQTDPDGSLASFSFTGTAAGSISDGQQIVVSNLVPGAYSSTETVPEGWELTGISCNDANSSGSGATATFNVEAGETVTCTFNNLEIKICELGERLVSVTLKVTGLSESPVNILPVEKKGQVVTGVNVELITPPAINVAEFGTVFKVTPSGGAANFETQNLKFLINGEESKNLKVHLSCSDDPAVGDVHFGNNASGVSVELTKTALSSAPKAP